MGDAPRAAPYSEDAMQDELTRRIENIVDLDLDTLTVTLSNLIIHLLQLHDFELNAYQVSKIHSIALSLASDLHEEHISASNAALHIVELVRTNANIPEDIDFWSSLYEKLPTKEQAAEAYLFAVFSPLMAIGYTTGYVARGAVNVAWNYVSSLVSDEHRKLAYLGLGLAAAGVFYTVAKE